MMETKMIQLNSKVTHINHDKTTTTYQENTILQTTTKKANALIQHELAEPLTKQQLKKQLIKQIKILKHTLEIQETTDKQKYINYWINNSRWTEKQLQIMIEKLKQRGIIEEKHHVLIYQGGD